nr:carboxypeptidase regulatory-like domain-containing protein [Acidobacteriota bacterium]
AEGRGIYGVRVTITNSNGETRYAFSDPFGYYRFADVPAGETYVFSVSHKRYTFNQSTQVRMIVQKTYDVNFVADN